MKVTVELHGATKDLSKNNFLEFEIKKNSSIKDIKIEILKFIEKKFKGNQNLKKLIESSAFCSEDDEIIFPLSEHAVPLGKNIGGSKPLSGN